MCILQKPLRRPNSEQGIFSSKAWPVSLRSFLMMTTKEIALEKKGDFSLLPNINKRL